MVRLLFSFTGSPFSKHCSGEARIVAVTDRWVKEVSDGVDRVRRSRTKAELGGGLHVKGAADYP